MSLIPIRFFRSIASSAAIALLSFAPRAAATMPPASGVAPAELIHAVEEGLLRTPDPSHGLPASSVGSVWRVPVVLVSFSDSLLSHTGAEFNHLLFDTTGSTETGSAFDYFRWVSRGRFTLKGEVVGTVHLGRDRLWYGDNAYGLGRDSPHNAFGMVWDALTACQASVNWSDYDLDYDGYVDMLWVVHAGIGGETSQDRNNMWSITSRLTGGWRGGTFFNTSDPVPGSSTQKMRIDRFTVLPELSSRRPGAISEIGVYCHEFGHALGLPDLYTVALFTGQIDQGPGCWSLMSTGAYGADARSPQYPAHPGAWPLQFLGWDQTFRPERNATVTLEPIEDTGSIMELWFQGESNPEHFLVENRQRLSFDRNLIAEGLIVYHVDDAIIWSRLGLNSINSGGTPGLRLVEADGDEDLVSSRNVGDVNDPFPGALGRVRFDDATIPNTRTFMGAPTNIALEDIQPVGDAMRFRARVEADGWRAPVDVTGAGFAPVDSRTLARSMGVDDQGHAYWVASETRGGQPQIYLRSGRGRWEAPFQVTASPGSALDPSIAVLPGGDLAIVWVDDRSGRAEIWFRSRIRGVWTSERRLVGMAGHCRAPALGADGRGGLSMAFLHLDTGPPQLRFLRFTWFSPFGQSMPVTTFEHRPGVPALAVAANGASYIVWSDWSSAPQRLWFARAHPDSGVTGSYTLTHRPSVQQLDPGVTVDRTGALHVVWQTSGPGNSQIHYQRRHASGVFPADTILETKGHILQNPTIAIDTTHTLHVTYESFPTASAEIRYLRFVPGSGWDAVSTRLTNPMDGSASAAQVLPHRKNDLTVSYLQYTSGGLRIFTRQRQIGGAAAVPPSEVGRALLRAGPNPLRSGQGIRVWLEGHAPESPWIEVFDVGGRRVARARLEPAGSGWLARLPSSTTRAWMPGVFFARVPGVARNLRIVVVR